MPELLFCIQGTPWGWMGMGSLAPVWDSHPPRSWGAAGKWNAANGICEREGDTPTPLFPKISDGGFSQEGLVWSSVQFLGVQYQL